MRILGDPELRLQYDDIRHERLTSATRKKQPEPMFLRPRKVSSGAIGYRIRNSTRHGSPTEPVIKDASSSKKQRFVTPEQKPKKRTSQKQKARYASESEDDDDTRQECPTADQTFGEEQTIMTETSYRSEGTMLTAPPTGARAIIGRVKDEVLGAMEDTATSFAQVLNAFTLQEEDIKAVTKRINKAAKQMKTTL